MPMSTDAPSASEAAAAPGSGSPAPAPAPRGDVFRYRPSEALSAFYKEVIQRYRCLADDGMLTFCEEGMIFRGAPGATSVLRVNVSRELFTEWELPGGGDFTVNNPGKGGAKNLSGDLDFKLGETAIVYGPPDNSWHFSSSRVEGVEHVAHPWEGWPVAYLNHKAVTSVGAISANSRGAPVAMGVRADLGFVTVTSGERSCSIALRHDDWGQGVPPPASKTGSRARPAEPSALCRESRFPVADMLVPLPVFGRVFRGYKLKDGVSVALAFSPEGDCVSLVMQPDHTRPELRGKISLELLFMRPPCHGEPAVGSASRLSDDSEGEEEEGDEPSPKRRKAEAAFFEPAPVPPPRSDSLLVKIK